MNAALLARRPPRIPAAGLVVLYDFVQGADPQQLLDRSAAGQPARLGASAGADGSDPAWTAQGLLFDGVDDYVATPNPVLGSAYTLIALSTPTDYAGWRIAVGTDTSAAYLGFRTGSGNPFMTATRASDSAQVSIEAATASSPAGKAVLLAGRAGGGEMALFTAGRKAASQATVPLAPRTLAALGRNTSTGTLLIKGQMHWVAAYDRPLSDAEISLIYRALRPELARRGVSI